MANRNFVSKLCQADRMKSGCSLWDAVAFAQQEAGTDPLDNATNVSRARTL